mgnify:CR=1 FL=1
MNTLLVFFAIPVAIVVLSIILETLLHNPYKVAGIFFSILLVTVFAIDITATLIALLIVYTVLSLITAYLVKLLCERRPFPCYRNYCNAPVNNTLFEGDEEPNNAPNNPPPPDGFASSQPSPTITFANPACSFDRFTFCPFCKLTDIFVPPVALRHYSTSTP